MYDTYCIYNYFLIGHKLYRNILIYFLIGCIVASNIHSHIFKADISHSIWVTKQNRFVILCFDRHSDTCYFFLSPFYFDSFIRSVVRHCLGLQWTAFSVENVWFFICLCLFIRSRCIYAYSYYYYYLVQFLCIAHQLLEWIWKMEKRKKQNQTQKNAVISIFRIVFLSMGFDILNISFHYILIHNNMCS